MADYLHQLLHTAKKINRLPALVDNPPMWPHFVQVIVQHQVDLLKESWVSV